MRLRWQDLLCNTGYSAAAHTILAVRLILEFQRSLAENAVKELAMSQNRTGMHPGVEMRLRDLAENIANDLALLKEYEEALRCEDDPGRIAKYRRNIGRLRESASLYKQEHTNLTIQLAGTRTIELHDAGLHLQQMNQKLDAVLDGQKAINTDLYNLRQALLSRYDSGERRIINSIAERLDQNQVQVAQAVLDALEHDKLEGTEITLVTQAVEHKLAELQRQGIALPEQQGIADAFSAPQMNVKHKLKLSIPLIPLLLSYEGEVEVVSGLNLESAWKSLVGKAWGGRR